MTEPPTITCRELADFIAEYLDGTLPLAMRREFERHLVECPSCVAYVESYRRTIQMGKTAMHSAADPVTGDVPEGVVRAILAACNAPDRCP